MATVALVMVLQTCWFTQTAVATNGVVFQPAPVKSGNGYNDFRPHIQFVDSQGQQRSFVPGGSNHYAGEKMEVLYDPAQPEHARINSFFGLWGIPLILFFAGIPFSAIYIGFTLWLRQRSVPKWLKANGQLIEADVQQIDFSGVNIGGWSPYVIVAQWVDKATNSAYIFRSGPLLMDPRAYVKAGDKIKVIIDPANPKKYFVDTSCLPKVVE